MSDDLSPFLKTVATGAALSADEAAQAFGVIMRGEASDIHLAAFLSALTVRGPTVAEVTGASQAMRAAMIKVKAPEGAIDLVGTGGDGLGTLNISTAAAFVTAACGVPVAKHGNRKMTSLTGATDVLEALGIKTDLSAAGAERCLAEVGLCFLSAQTYHAAMRYVTPVRRALGFRTIFNILGPVSNPAGVKRQLLGVYDDVWLSRAGEALRELGAEKAWIVHGVDGLDEISISGETRIVALEDGIVTAGTISPEDAGLPRSPLSTVLGGDAAENARAMRRIFDGEKCAYRDIVLLNAAGALIVADKAKDLREGAALAAKAIDSGAAKAKLEKLIAVSQS
jgi:anthranilate phosphoribosyltransferase